MTIKRKKDDEWVDPHMGEVANREVEIWAKKEPKGQKYSKYYSIFDQARLASKIARAACGTADPALVKYLMERMQVDEDEIRERRIEEISVLQMVRHLVNRIINVID